MEKIIRLMKCFIRVAYCTVFTYVVNIGTERHSTSSSAGQLKQIMASYMYQLWRSFEAGYRVQQLIDCVLRGLVAQGVGASAWEAQCPRFNPPLLAPGVSLGKMLGTSCPVAVGTAGWLVRAG